MTIFGREPVAVVAVVNALMALGVGFGLDVSNEQQALIQGAATAVLALIARRSVTPNVTTEEHIDTAVRLAQLGRFPPYDDTTGSP